MDELNAVSDNLPSLELLHWLEDDDQQEEEESEEKKQSAVGAAKTFNCLSGGLGQVNG